MIYLGLAAAQPLQQHPGIAFGQQMRHARQLATLYSNTWNIPVIPMYTSAVVRPPLQIWRPRAKASGGPSRVTPPTRIRPNKPVLDFASSSQLVSRAPSDMKIGTYWHVMRFFGKQRMGKKRFANAAARWRFLYFCQPEGSTQVAKKDQTMKQHTAPLQTKQTRKHAKRCKSRQCGTSSRASLS